MLGQKPKILVEIISEDNKRIQKKKFPREGNKIVIKPPRRGPGGAEYAPTFTKDSVIRYESGIWPFKTLKEKLILKENADACIDFVNNETDIASWDRKSLEDASKASVIKTAGATTQKIEVPLLLYLLIGGNLFLSFVILLRFAGAIKF